MGLFRKTLSDAEAIFLKCAKGNGTEADIKEALKIIRQHLLADFMSSDLLGDLSKESEIYKGDLNRIIIEAQEIEHRDGGISKSVADSFVRMLGRTKDGSLKKMEKITKQLMERELTME
jgi:hypothetical protein